MDDAIRKKLSRRNLLKGVALLAAAAARYRRSGLTEPSGKTDFHQETRLVSIPWPVPPKNLIDKRIEPRSYPNRLVE